MTRLKARAFGMALKKVRKEKGISRAELARLLQVTYKNVWFWEVGRHYPRGPVLVRLLSLFPELVELTKQLEQGGNGNGAKRKER